MVFPQNLTGKTTKCFLSFLMAPFLPSFTSHRNNHNSATADLNTNVSLVIIYEKTRFFNSQKQLMCIIWVQTCLFHLLVCSFGKLGRIFLTHQKFSYFRRCKKDDYSYHGGLLLSHSIRNKTRTPFPLSKLFSRRPKNDL